MAPETPAQLASAVIDALRAAPVIQDETWRRCDSEMDEHTIVEEIRSLLLERHPEWLGQEWIEPGLHCLCAEHVA